MCFVFVIGSCWKLLRNQWCVKAVSFDSGVPCWCGYEFWLGTHPPASVKNFVNTLAFFFASMPHESILSRQSTSSQRHPTAAILENAVRWCRLGSAGLKLCLQWKCELKKQRFSEETFKATKDLMWKASWTKGYLQVFSWELLSKCSMHPRVNLRSTL